MFRLASYDVKNNHLNNKIIKINHIVTKALTELRYDSSHHCSLKKKMS